MLLYDEQNEKDRDAVSLVRERMELAKPFHDRWRENAERRYALYRSYQQFRGGYRKLSPPDADDFWDQMRSTFGGTLFIPHAFAAVETTVPRMMTNRPKMSILPRDKPSESNVENMKALIDAQQEQIRYEMAVQPVIKTALIYGTGVQKTFWRTEMRDKTRWVERGIREVGKSDFLQKTQQEVYFDDPDCAEVDPFDFFWDPYGYDMRTCGWVIHRTWRTTEYVKKQVESGAWRNVTLDDLEGLGPGSSKRDEVWEQRMAAAGYDQLALKGNKLHEVWEYHDRSQVITVLNNEIVVAAGENPYWHGDLPFQVYRPTFVPQELAGIGIIEPIEDLQREMNGLRSVRRDASLLAINKPIAYWDGLVDPDEVRFGVGSLIPVPGNPRELIQPFDVGDVPGSSYQEEERIESDIERVSGISDPVSGGESNSGSFATATGAQLVHQATTIRIENMIRRADYELIAPACAQWVAMNQQKIVSPRDVRTAANPQPGEIYGKRWQWMQLGPNEMAGGFDVVPEGTSAPENVAQMRQDAQMLVQLFGQDPTVDHRRIIVKALEGFGIKQAETYITAPEPRVDPNVVGQILVEQVGLDEAMVQQILQAGQVAVEQQQQGEPVEDANQLLAAIGGQNGDAPPEG